MTKGTGVASDPFDLDSSDEESNQGSNSALAESESDSEILEPPPRQSRIPPLDDSSRSGTSPRPGVSGQPSTVLATPKAPQRLTNIQNASGLPIKASPSSLGKNNTSIPKPRLQFPTEDVGYVSPNDESGEDEEEGRNSQLLRASPDTPSRQPSRGLPKTYSQKSIGTSIRSSSPLVSRLKQKRSETAPSKLKDNLPSISSLENSLHGFEQDMREDHALTVRWLLHDSKEAVANAKPLFMDKVSPFAAMKSVQVLPGEAVSNETATLKLESYVSD
jgi:hypothetical protein